MYKSEPLLSPFQKPPKKKHGLKTEDIPTLALQLPATAGFSNATQCHCDYFSDCGTGYECSNSTSIGILPIEPTDSLALWLFSVTSH